MTVELVIISLTVGFSTVMTIELIATIITNRRK